MIDKDLLVSEYVVKGKSISNISVDLKVDRGTVCYWLRKHSIPINKRSGGKNLIDLTHEKFGYLEVICKVNNEKNTSAKWLCKCVCGNTKEVVRTSLIKGITTSCGCKKSTWKGFGKLSKSYWNRVEKGAKSRGLEFNVTIQDAWNKFVEQNEKCALTGLPISIITDYTHKHSSHTASLDRIDNNKGYILDNIQWTHRIINIMRRNMSVSDFVFYCKKVAEHETKSFN